MDNPRRGRNVLLLSAAVACATCAAPAGLQAQTPPTRVFITAGNRVAVYSGTLEGLGQVSATFSNALKATAGTDGRSVFILNRDGKSITPIAIGLDGSLAAKSPVILGQIPFDMAISPDGQRLYVSALFRLYVIDVPAALNDQSAILRDMSMPFIFGQFNSANLAVAVSPNGETLYVAAQNSNLFTGQSVYTVYDLDPNNNLALRKTFSSTVGPVNDIEFRWDSGRAFFASGSNTAMLVDVAGSQVAGTVTLPAVSQEFSARVDQKAMLSTDDQFGRVHWLDDVSLAPVRTVPMTVPLLGETLTQFRTRNVASNQDGDWIFATLNHRSNADEWHLRRYDVSKGGVTTFIQVSGFPSPVFLSGMAVTFPRQTQPADTERPTLAGATPVPGELDVALNSQVVITFSEPMRESTLAGAFSVFRRSDGLRVSDAGTITTTPTTLAFTPADPLATGEDYDVAMTASASDLAGNALMPFAFSFQAAIFPYVTSTYPGNGDTRVPANAEIRVNFNEPMDNPAVHSAFSFKRADTGAPVAGVVDFPSGSHLRFTPLNPLDFETRYTADVSVAAKDFKGNAMAAPFSFSFTTRVQGPNVQITIPTPGSNVHDPLQRIQATYTATRRPLAPSTIQLSLLQGPARTPVIDVTYANGTGNGTVTTETTFLQTARAFHQTVSRGGFLYAIGGEIPGTPAPTASIEKAPILPDGSVGGWTAAGVLPVGLARFCAVARGDKLYILGGQTSANFSTTDVYVGTFQPDGTVGSFTPAPALRFDANESACALVDRFSAFIYVVGGLASSRTQYAPIDSNGNLGAWRETAPVSLSPSRSLLSPQLVQWRDRLYLIGGSANASQGSVDVLTTTADRDGHLPPWQPAASVPAPVWRGVAVRVKDEIVYFGGGGASAVHYADIDSDGSLRWRTGSPLPVGQSGAAGAAEADTAYLTGGQTIGFSKEALRSHINGGDAVSAVATAIGNEGAPLLGLNHTVSALVQDSEGNEEGATASFQFTEMEFPKDSTDGLAHIESNVDGLEILKRTLSAQEQDLALFDGLLSPFPFVVYDVTDTQFDTPARFSISWVEDPNRPGFVNNTFIRETNLVLRRFENGAWVTVQPQTSDLALNLISAELLHASLYALFAPEENAPVTSITAPPSGSTVTALSSPFFVATTTDNSRIDAGANRLYLDSQDVTSLAIISETGVQFTPTLLPADGVHVFTLKVGDVAGNFTVASSTFAIDSLPPSSSYEITGASDVVGGTIVIAAQANVGLSATDNFSGVARIEVSKEGAAFSAYTGPFGFNEGIHVLQFRAIDLVGNMEPAHSLTLNVDASAPLTSLAVIGGKQAPGGDSATFYASPATQFALRAIDHVVGGVASGFGISRFQDNGGPFQIFTATFAFSEGSHLLAYQSQDRVQNLEVLRSTTILVDANPPQSSVLVGSQSFSDSGSVLYVSPGTLVGITAQDPALPGGQDGAGSEKIEVSVNGGPYFVFMASLSFAGGAHTVNYRAVDRVGNMEALRTLSLRSDAGAPVSTVQIGAPSFVDADGTRYISPASPVTLSAQDPALPGGAAGSGIARIEVSLDGGAFTAYTGTMTFAEGRHTVLFRAVDNMGNTEATQTLALRSDASMPLTSLSAQGGRLASGPDTATFYASTATRFSLPATDPLSSDVTSGLAFTRYQDNGGAFETYSTPFALTEGTHALGYQSQDRVNNLEVLRSTTILMDATPPHSEVNVGSPSYTGVGGILYITAATPIGFTSQDPALPGGQSGSGVEKVEVSVDGAAYVPFAANLSFSGGSHTILYRAIDRVGNTETTKTLSLRSDADAPVSAYQIGSPTFLDTDGTRYVTPATPVTFTAQDPQEGSGVARIEVSVDGAGFTTYAAPRTFPEGRHTILFRAVDQLGNVEAAQTLTLRSDASTPQTSLALQGGRQASGPDATTFYASTATRFALPALDPLVADVASGLAFTNWQDNGGAFQAYTAPIAFSAGVHQLSYQSQDRVTNLETLRSTTVRVDGGAPFTVSQYSSPNAIISGVRYVTPATLLGFPSSDLPISSSIDGSGLDRVMVAVDGGPFVVFTASLTFTEGRHTVRFRGFDRVENAEAIKTVSPWSDGTAPRTTLSFLGGLQAPGPSPDTFYASSGTRISLSAVDPLVANVSAGLDFIRWQDNGGTFQNYVAPIALTEGVHIFGYQSQDRITNLEVLRSSTVLVDATAPTSTVTVGFPAFVDAGGARFVTPATPVTFSAQDPALPGGTPGSGVERIEVSVDGSPFSTYSTPLTFAQGLHTVAYRSKDRVGNVEVAQALTLRSDGAAPLTTLAIQGGKQASGPDAASFFASSDTRLALLATDPPASEDASGVDFTRWRENGGAFQTYAAPLDFPEGVHLIAYQSQDRVGNAEILRSTTILVDATAPTASLSVGLPRADRGGTRYVSSSTLLTINAEDPNSAGTASGVGLIEKSVDGAPFTAYSGAFSLAGGLRLISARATDRVGNASLVLSSSVVADAGAPEFTALAPGAGAVFLPSGPGLEVVVQATDDHDTAPSISAVLVQLEDRGSPRGNRPAVVPVQHGSSFAALDLDDGLWELRAGAIDFVANEASAVSGPFEVIHDLMPPRTSLTAGTPFALVAGASVVARGSILTLASVDDLVSLDDASGLGVAAQQVSVDGIIRATFTAPMPGPGIVFMSTFSLTTEADGWHEVTFFATDVLGNIEPSHVSTFGIDDTPPETSLAVQGGRQATGPDSLTFYASSGTQFALPAVDRVINGVASGVDFTQWQDNGGTFTAYSAPFALSEGPHLLAYQTQDRLGKLEVLRSTTVLIDAAAPQSSSTFALPTLVDSDGTRFVTPATMLSLLAQDPALPGGTAGSGVERIEVSANGDAFSTYTSTLTFAEGRHTVQFRAVDRVDNVETAQTLSLHSDASAPQTALITQGGRQSPGGTGFYASSDTRFALAAVDPIVADVAAGVDFTRWQDNGGAFQVYSAPFSLSEGTHLLGFQSQDRISNLEALGGTTVYVDATPPVSSYAIGDPLYSGVGAVKFITPATPVTFSAEDLAVPGGTPGAGTDRIEVAVDGGAFVTYSAALTFAEGRHTVLFRAVDRVGNVEAVQSLTLHSDATEPETSLAVQGGKQAPSTDISTFYASSDTRFALPSTDPIVADVASGVDFTTYRDNGGAIQPYSEPFALSAGSHLLSYQSRDVVRNQEVSRSTTVLVDATPPLTTFAIGAPSFLDSDGTRYITPATPVSFTASDPAMPGGTAGSGVERIEVSVDGGAFTAYTSALIFAEGRHTVEFRAIDRVGNVEPPQSLALRSDASTPETSLAIQGGKQVAGPNPATFYASSDTRFTLPSADPEVANVAAGVDFTRWQDNGGPFQAYSSPLTLPEGAHRLDFQSQDRVANLEVLRNVTVYVDAAAPVSSYSIGDPLYTGVGAVKYITPATPVTFSAEDPALPGGTPGAGTDRIEVAIDGGAFVTYSAALTFAEGRHTVLFRAIDRVGNVEAAQTLALRSDATAPETSLAVQGGRQVDGTVSGTFYASSDTRFALPASDPLVADVASGVDFTTYRINGGAIQPYSEPFILSAGSHLLSYQSRDTVRNQEVSRSTTVLVDSEAPVSSYSIGEPLYNAPGGIKFITPATPLTFSATDPSLPGGIAGSGVERIEVAVDGGAFTTYSSALTFVEGRHTVEFRAVDRVGNIEPTQSLALRSDASAPETSLAVQGGKQAPAAEPSTFYASSDTSFSLPAADPIVADVASGVDFTAYRDNDGPEQTFSSAFTLPEGAHSLSYQSRDRVANLETQRSTTVLVDATAPLSSFVIGAPAFVDQDGIRYIAPATPVTFTAQDPTLPGGTAGSGVERIEVAVNGGAFITYVAALTFAEGRHTVLFRAVDRVGNVEAVQSLALRSDASAPMTSLAPQGGRQAAGPDNDTFYASSDTRFTLSAFDPIEANVTSGLDFTRWQDSGGAFQAYSAPFALAEGSHILAYQSQDRVANLEVLRSTTILVDATAPQSSFSIGTPTFVDTDGTRYVTPTTQITFVAQDPALPGGAAGSGVERIEVAVNGGAFGPYSTPLVFAEGRHTVQFRAIDRVGNIEGAQTLALRSDQSAPQTSLTVQGGTQAPGPDASSLYASSATRVVLTATDPTVAEVTSGVDFIRWQDNGGPLSSYNAPLTLTEGAHLLAYQSQDRVENLEVLRSTTILVDATAPQSAFAIGLPSFTGSDGTRFISPATPVSFTAQDPSLPGGTAGSGVERIEVAVDGGAFAAYTAALTFAEGPHTVQFRAIDRVGNVEATQSLSLRSDNSAPQTSLAVQGGRQVAGPTTESFYASSDTRLAFAATDPTVADVASGVDFTRWQDAGGAFQTYSAPFALAEGSHLLAYQSQDNVTNLEALKSTTVIVDASAPNSTFAIGAPSFIDGDGTRYVTPGTPVSFSALDPALPGGTAGSGVERIEVAIDGGAFAPYAAALTFAEGRHTVLFRAIDGVGNVEATQSLALRSDASAPQTSLAAIGGRQAIGPDADTFYASGDSRFIFPASDPVTAEVASGVDFTRWRDGSGAFQTYSAPVALAEGSHLLTYQSQDQVANLEILRSTTVLVDASAPQSAFAIGAPSFVAPDGTRYVTPATPVTFSASDPALPGGTAGSGVDRIEVAVDGAAFTLYTAALTFPEGRHTVQFRAVDRVGNSEAPQTLALRSDATPPQTAFSPSAAFYSNAGRDYAPAQFTYTLPAADPLVSDVASGVAETTFGIDAAPRQAYTGAFSLSEGIRTVSFGSRDNVTNLEEERSATVHVDATAPQTSLAVSGGQQALGPDANSFYASLDTRFSLTSMDPSVAGVASGLDSTSWQDNGGAFQAFDAPIALDAGSHILSYRSQDHVGNVEVLRSTTVLVDGAAPVTVFQIGTPAFMAADGTRYVTPTTPVTFTAVDPALAGGTAGSGVKRIEVSVDGAPYSTYTGALTFAEGRHTVQYRAVDRVGNVEMAGTLALRSDASAPLTSLAAQGGRQTAGPDANSFYASLDTRFALPAADPIVSDVAAGLDITRWQANGGTFETYTAPLALAEGSHLLAYQSQDKVQNQEVLRSTTVLIDATAPMTAFNIGAPSYTDAAGVHYVTPTTPVTFTALDPALPGGTAGSGVERIEVALNAADFQTYSGALTFAEGRHSIRFRAYDRVGNVEAERTLEIRSDASAPLSSLAVQGGRQTAGPDAASQYASADTRFVLSASDPLVADVASGVEFIRWRDNGGAFQTYAAPIALAEGSHVLTYQSQDKVQNVETLRSTTVLVDATPPHTAFQIGTPAFIDLSGTHYITPTTPVTFNAEDPMLPGGTAGSGVERIEVAVDGGAFVPYGAALTFPEGRHTVQFRTIDRVGNVEAAQTLSLRSDASAPLTALNIQGGRQAAGENATTFYASSATRYALAATDPVVADVASGVEFTRWQDNGGALMSYSGPIAFPEGIHVLTYASEDRVRNVEAQKSVTALVDATPPITQFTLNGPRYAHAAGDLSVGGELFVSPTTGIDLAPLDPVSNGVASGLERLLASIDGGPFLPWMGSISFAPEGTHTIAYRGADRVGNEEGTRSVSVAVDATAPSTMLTFDGPALLGGAGTAWEPPQAEAFITPVTKVILTTNDPTSAGVASGVKLTRFRIDSGPWQVYTGFFYLSNQGLHLVEFAAEDRVGNLETIVAKRIAVDNTAPVVSAALNGSWLEAFGLNLLSTAATVSLTANDSPIAGVAVGLARILYRIDGGGLTEYTAPFTLAAGSHTIAYHGVDLLGNSGAPQTLAVRVLRFLGGSLAATGGIDGSGTADVGGLLQTNGGLGLTGNFTATGGAEAFSISLKGGASLTGPVTQGVRPLLSDWVDLAAIQTTLEAANDNASLPSGTVTGGVLRLKSGQTVTLATGTYLLSGIDISGGAKLLTAGPVRIFVTGAVKTGGNSALNEGGPARNLVIFGSGNSADLTASAAAAILYFPSATMSLSGEMRLGGSALAATISLTGNSNATTPGLEASAPAATSGGNGNGSRLASLDGGVGFAAGGLDASFVLRDIYAFPNPAVGGQRPVIHAAVGMADRVTIRIYDIAGQPVHEATVDAPQIIDDGGGPQYAYEYPWGGHIPSGVYLYSVTAEKAGNAPIKRIGKLAVVR